MARWLALLLAGGAWAVPAAPALSAEGPPGEVVAFSALPGFARDDFGAASRVFQASCRAMLAKTSPMRPAAQAPSGLTRICAALPPKPNRAARRFFETHFVPYRVASDAFFTGYFEPVVEGSLVRTRAFATPLYAPPKDLVSVKPGVTPGLDPALNAARRLSDGRLVAMPDRAGIEIGALGSAARPLVYVRSPVDAFFIQIQGSARIRLPNGALRRVAFAGRNGYPYTSIGKLLVARLHVPPSEMGLAQLRAWIQNNGQGPNEAGTALMHENRSFIFFAFDDKLPAKAGPLGGEGVSLTPGRSVAIDRAAWPYGLPFYVDTSLPDGRSFRRLMVGQDTGAAILGAARADIFFGTGDAAAREAGPVRQRGTLYVLWPKDVARPTTKHKAVGR